MLTLFFTSKLTFTHYILAEQIEKKDQTVPLERNYKVFNFFFEIANSINTDQTYF